MTRWILTNLSDGFRFAESCSLRAPGAKVYCTSFMYGLKQERID